MSEMYQQTTQEADAMFKQSADKFAAMVSSMKQMALEMHNELEATRNELRRGVLEMPQEAAESTSQMRKVIVDQIEALAELSAGRTSAPRDEEPMQMHAVAAAGRSEAPAPVRTAPPRPREAASSASSLPPPDLGAPASRRTEAPPVSPANPEQGRDGWLSDLLNRADVPGSNREAPRGRAPQTPGVGANPLESLSLDISRMMDRNLASEMWDRYQRGESKAFTKRLYTPAGQKAFDERATIGDPRRCAATSSPRPGWSIPCSPTRRDGSARLQADRGIKTEAAMPRFFCFWGRSLATGKILDIFLDSSEAWESAMANTAQKRALRNYRTRLVKRGMARFEVLGLDSDRDLIRSLAKRLAEDDPDALRIRAAVSRTITGEPPKKGGILAALRRSPLVGADLSLARSHEAGRKVDL